MVKIIWLRVGVPLLLLLAVTGAATVMETEQFFRTGDSEFQICLNVSSTNRTNVKIGELEMVTCDQSYNYTALRQLRQGTSCYPRSGSPISSRGMTYPLFSFIQTGEKVSCTFPHPVDVEVVKIDFSSLTSERIERRWANTAYIEFLMPEGMMTIRAFSPHNFEWINLATYRGSGSEYGFYILLVFIVLLVSVPLVWLVWIAPLWRKWKMRNI